MVKKQKVNNKEENFINEFDDLFVDESGMIKVAKNNKKNRDDRGKAGAIALKKNATEKIKVNKKALVKALKKFRDEKIPLVKTELAKESGLSIPTLNRSPYKEIIRDYLNDEKVLLSPNGRQEVSDLIKENTRLRYELKDLQERYDRLKKELIFTKELFS